MTDLILRRPRLSALRAPGLLAVLVAMLVGFAFGSPAFLTSTNLGNVLTQGCVLLLIALPMTLVIMTEGLDLSVGAVVSLASVCGGLVAVSTGSLAAALAAAVAVGGLCGFLNGLLVAHLRIPPFVATLGTLGMAQGTGLLVSDGQSVTGIPPAVQAFYAGRWLGVPMPLWLMVGAYLVHHLLLYRTTFGANVFGLGGNREALALAGISWRRDLALVYILSGAMAGLAGLVLMARLSAGHPTAGLGLEFDAIAAVALGGTSFERGNGWLPGTALGVLSVGVLRNGLNLMAVPSSLQVCCIGLLVLLAFISESLRGERR